jgi:hypothetical protein
MNFEPARNIARVMHSLSQPLPLDLPRRSFSVHFARSVHLKRHVPFTDSLAQKVVVFADTDVDVAGYALGGPTWTYADKDGELRATSPFITVNRRSGPGAYWDFSWTRPRQTLPFESAIKEARARVEGMEYRVFRPADFLANSIEYDNRSIAQKLLYDGLGVDTQALEARVLMDLELSTLETISKRLDLSVTRAAFVVLRLWLRGLVEVPMAVERFGPAWPVKRCGHAR